MTMDRGHTLQVEAGPDTVHWGFFDASLTPIAVVESGETIIVSTVSGTPEVLASAPYPLPEALSRIHRADLQRMPGHICTGPIAVSGARPGQILQVDIEEVSPFCAWGYTGVRPLRGALPDDFDERRLIHIPFDLQRKIGRLPWGSEIELRPFFGVMAVAPPANWGRISTIPPRRNGGNIDNKELVAGSTLYLPIFCDDALFSVGDGHAAQGDGEVCVNGIETSLIGRLRLSIRDDFQLTWPMAETPGHVITMAFHPDLDTCVEIALRQMVHLIHARAGLNLYEAYMLCSLAADLRITQVVNENKGVHCMLAKRHLAPKT
jgi:acetamidase/formamidase